MENKEKTFLLSIVAFCGFIADSVIDDEFKNSKEVRKDIAEIPLPYVRSFISSFLLMSGHTPIIVPDFELDPSDPDKNENKKIIKKSSK